MKPEIPIEAFEIFADGLDHPEGLAFDREGNLWAGGEAGQVYRIDPKGKVTEVAKAGGFSGGFAFSPDDELFVCNPAHGVLRVARDGKWEVFASHAGGRRIVCPNYPVFDRTGNLYVSDSGEWGEKNGYIVRLDKDGNGEILAGPFGYANGLALSADDRHLYMVVSDTAEVLRFEVTEGGLSRAEVFAEDVGRVPDGLAFDAPGNLYVSCYASDDIYRITPEGKKTLFAYDPNGMKLGRPTNVAFGIRDRDWLYAANLGRYVITRAPVGVTGQELANYPAGAGLTGSKAHPNMTRETSS